ncbi:zinc finger CCCH domain-containing protein 5 isoform X1 [Arachis hypogaea]|uniref:zinc finger CCCH domain-containing protein 5 isoform X1 n=1 Tax=Arachis hypogaea TaxID=3818 RepID=UPI0034E72EE6
MPAICWNQWNLFPKLTLRRGQDFLVYVLTEAAKMKENKGEEEEEKKEMSRKEKRKALKKMKRKQIRKEIAVKEREKEEARINDPDEKRRMQLLEQQEAERMESDRKLFEERERAWMELQQRIQQQQEQQQQQIDLLEESQSARNDNGSDNDDDQWEYVEEGPPEIIWQGNEIILKRNKVRVRISNKETKQNQHADDADRPTSNPLPPESHSNSFAQQVLENVAQQVPNFGTEQDKAHCPFHLKTGACRFGQRCSRVHFYPDKSCTLLMKNMYNGPGLAWEQDEGLEYTDEEVERCFEEFYDDVHTEFQKFGEIVNFKVCKNGAFHLRGNVYVQYKHLDSALLAYNTVNGRYFAGKQVSCNFVSLTRWKVAICGEYMKSGYKTCSHGTACNFIHCFRNPGGDYEWADSDRPPPKYWVKKMIALFGYSDDYEALGERENLSLQKNTGEMSRSDSFRYHSSRSRSRERDQLKSYSSRRKHGDERRQRTPDEAWNAHSKENKHKTLVSESNREWLEKDENRESHHKHYRKSSLHSDKDDSRRSHDEDFDTDLTITGKDDEVEHGKERRHCKKRKRDRRDRIYESESEHHTSRRKSSRQHSRDNRTGEAESNKDLFDQGDLEPHDSSRKNLRHRRFNHREDNKDYDSEHDEVDGDWSRRERHRRSGYREDIKDHENECDEVDRGWSRWDGDGRSHHKKKCSRHHHSPDVGLQ